MRVGGRAGSGDGVDWPRTHAELAARPVDELSAPELDLLADALFWLDRVDGSVAVRRRAYRSYLDAGDVGQATLAAWRLFYEHHLVGEGAVANGWLERCRGHVAGDTGSGHGAWVEIAEADVALGRGDADAAVEHARRARRVGERLADADLRAMAMQAEGRAEIERGALPRGLAVLDEVMVAVISGELTELFTGWVYCNVVSTCYGLADLRRASEWSAAAMRWCDSLRDGLMYPGLCRVYAVELAYLRGAWDTAAADAELARTELVAFDARYAGEAHYLVGELRRLRGDDAGAETAYADAHRLGRPPQPGLALLRFAQGRRQDALTALRAADRPGPSAPLPHAQLLAALISIEVEVGQLGAARETLADLHALDRQAAGPVIGAIADGALGRVALAGGDPGAALGHLRRAWRVLHDLGLAPDEARLRVQIGLAARALGDEDTAHLEWRAALDTFDRLGARPDAARVRALLSGDPPPVAGGAGTAGAEPPLTDREVEVLRLVAAGSTNRDVATALHLSPHTVSRHLSNIFAKAGVTSRAAATAWAYEHDLVGHETHHG